MDYVFIAEPDSDTIAQVGKLYCDAGWWNDAPDHPEHIRSIIKGSHCFLIAFADGKAIGMGRAISDLVSDAYIQDVTVEEEWRGKGCAKEIVRTLIEQLRKDGIQWIGLIAERGTHNLYGALGFTEMPNSTPLLLEGPPDEF
ncbi:MAG: GNAT family N-acetyltransferase [Proteobacteria bacterium]|nr:GNAT family N-acetyltransferase [Pseudomonadota bacterium]